MRNGMGVIATLIALSAGSLSAKLVPGDARRGAEVLHSQNCLVCHRVRGEGGNLAPDLGKRIGRSYKPAWLTSTMWNHAPTMWAAMEKRGIQKPVLTEGQAADLFAYFHSVRFFEEPGGAERGKQVFASKYCAECHGIAAAVPGGGPPVAAWQALAAPLALAQQMWNHAAQMQTVMANRKIRWPSLTAQELTDLLVYLQNLPETRGRVGEFSLSAEGDGEALFKAKGCANCHVGKLALENRLVGGTLTDFTVAIWNHAPRMWRHGRTTGQALPTLERDEMGQIVAYLWYVWVFADFGSPERGRQVFQKKNCASCHNDSSSRAPELRKSLAGRHEPLRPFSMVSVLWQHGPAMLARMKDNKVVWPRFSGPEMADLIEYLNSSEFGGGKPRK